MSTTVEFDQAWTKLKDLIAQLGPNDEVVIIENNRPIARLLAPSRGQPQFGSCKGMLTIVQDDDEHLEDFKDYMQ